jgi:hypothetical protein
LHDALALLGRLLKPPAQGIVSTFNMGVAFGLTGAMLTFSDRLRTVSTRRHPACDRLNYGLLSPEPVTRLMRDEDDARPVGLMLHFGRRYLTAADDARSASAFVRLVHAAGGEQALLRQADSYLLPQLHL